MRSAFVLSLALAMAAVMFSVSEAKRFHFHSDSAASDADCLKESADGVDRKPGGSIADLINQAIVIKDSGSSSRICVCEFADDVAEYCDVLDGNAIAKTCSKTP